jgi:hypothetical protein
MTIRPALSFSMTNLTDCHGENQSTATVGHSAVGFGNPDVGDTWGSAGDNENCHHVVIMACQSQSNRRNGAIGHYGSGVISKFTAFVFVNQVNDYCTYGVSASGGIFKLVNCAFVNCAYLHVSGGSTTQMTNCLGTASDGSLIDQPGAVTTPLVCDLLNLGFACDLPTDCVAGADRASKPASPAESPIATLEESSLETMWESAAESGAESATESATDSKFESKFESKVESKKESARGSPPKSLIASASDSVPPTGIAPPTGSPTATYDCPACQCSSIGAAGAARGSSAPTTGWTIGVVAAFIAGAGLMAIIDWCVLVPRVGADKVAAEDRAEVGQSGPEVKGEPLEEPTAGVEMDSPSDKPEPSSDADAKSDGERQKGGAPAKKPVKGPQDAGDEKGAGSGREASGPTSARGGAGGEVGGSAVKKHAGRSIVPKKGAAAPAKEDDGEAGGDQPRVVNCEAVRVVAARGSRTSISSAFTEKLWKHQSYKAQFEPELAGLWLSSNKGTIEPGATEYPFALFFEPSSNEPLETIMIVSFGDWETRTPILASTGSGEAKRHRRRRSE